MSPIEAQTGAERLAALKEGERLAALREGERLAALRERERLAALRGAPLETREAAVLDALRRELGRVLDVDPDFLEAEAELADLGLDSLALMRLGLALQGWIGAAVPPALLPVTGRLGDVARIIAEALGEPDPVAALRGIRGARVRDAIAGDLFLLVGTGSARRRVSPQEAAEPRRVLLTGATGFVGAYLLDALLSRTRARVHCLVRAGSEAAGMARLREALERFGLPAEALRERVGVELGDLAAPRLGLPPERHEALAEGLDLIYHVGASVHLTQSYDEARGANVAGGRAILHLAGTGRLKPVAVVSTVGLFDTPELEGLEAITEGCGPTDPARLPNGYTQSKWAAERLVERAAAEGVPAATLRVGHVIGHGVSQDLAGRLMRACLASATVPRIERPVDYVPPRYVAAVLAELPRRPGFSGVYHVTNPAPLGPDDQAALMPLAPRALALREAGAWVAGLREAAARDPAHPLAPAIEALGDPDDPSALSFVEQVLRRPRIDCARTLEALAGAGIACPPAREVFLDVLLGMPELREPLAARG